MTSPKALRVPATFVALLLVFGCEPPIPAEDPAASSRSPLQSVGPEVALSAPFPAAGAGASSNPRIASDGTRYLVAFDDTRLGSSDVFAIRLRADGTHEDPYAFAVENLPGSAVALDVAYGGGVFLIAWRHNQGTTATLRAVRVSQAGAVLDATPLVLSNTISTRPRIAFGSGVFGVVWSTGGNVSFRTVTPAGASSSISTVCANGASNIPTIASDGADFYVTWRDSTTFSAGVYGTGVTAAGTVATSCGQLLVADGDWPSIAYSGGGYAVAWAGPSPGVSVARLQMNGSLAAGSSVMGSGADDPALAPFGTQFIVGFLDRSATPPLVKARLVSANGTASGGVIATGLTGYSAVVGAAGGDALVAGEPTSEILGQRIAPTGALLDTVPRLVSVGAPAQTRALTKPLDTGALSVWADSADAGVGDALATRLSATAQPLDAPPLNLAAAAGIQEPQGLASASGSGKWFVVWRDTRSGTAELRGARVMPTGVQLDPQGLILASAPDFAGPATVASDGTDFLAVYTSSSGGSALFGVRVSHEGPLQAPDALATFATGSLVRPVAEYSGGLYLVGATHEVSSNRDARVVRVSATGAALDPTPLTLGSGAGNQELWSLQPIPEGFLALLTDDVSGTEQLLARKVFLDGGVGAAVAVASGTDNDTAPAALSLPGHHLVVWQRTAPAAVASALWTIDLDPATLAPFAAPSPVTPTAGAESNPQLAALSDGNVLLTYSRPDSAIGAVRAFARLLVPTDAGVAGADGGAPPDGGEDAGSVQDGGVTDLDGGEGSDGGLGDPDGGTDSSSSDAGSRPLLLTVGCGCAEGGASAAGGPLLMLAAIAALRATGRRRTGRE